MAIKGVVYFALEQKVSPTERERENESVELEHVHSQQPTDADTEGLIY